MWLQVMMYMTGSSVSIISIMIVGMCLVNSVKSLGAVNKREYPGIELRCRCSFGLVAC